MSLIDKSDLIDTIERTRREAHTAYPKCHFTVKDCLTLIEHAKPVGDVPANCPEKLATLMVCAVWYALGRHSYMPRLVQDCIRSNAHLLNKATVYVMRRDITDYLRDTEAQPPLPPIYAMDCDAWRTFLHWLEAKEKEMKEHADD